MTLTIEVARQQRKYQTHSESYTAKTKAACTTFEEQKMHHSQQACSVPTTTKMHKLSLNMTSCCTNAAM
eukprot:4531721-Amphidinium_carterae.1